MTRGMQIRVMHAAQLAATNAFKGFSDPYVRITNKRTNNILTTSVCHNTCNPLWYETLYMNGA